MSEPRTIVHVISESPLNHGLLVTCDSQAAALYYLAYQAALRSLPLETVTADRVYRIGNVNYILSKGPLFSTEDVAALPA